MQVESGSTSRAIEGHGPTTSPQPALARCECHAMEVICQRFANPRCVDCSSPATCLIGSRRGRAGRTRSTSPCRDDSSVLAMTAPWSSRWTASNCAYGTINPNEWQRQPHRLADQSPTKRDGTFSSQNDPQAAATPSALRSRQMIKFHVHCSPQSEVHWNCSRVPEGSPFQLMTCVGSVSWKYDKTWECVYKRAIGFPRPLFFALCGIVKACGVAKSTTSAIRSGKRVPAQRHWEGLHRIVAGSVREKAAKSARTTPPRTPLTGLTTSRVTRCSAICGSRRRRFP